MQEQECGNCQYYVGGKCKYNPPPQPAVQEDDWCSHWCPGPMPEAPMSMGDPDAVTKGVE